jgi:hypothetical protein
VENVIDELIHLLQVLIAFLEVGIIFFNYVNEFRHWKHYNPQSVSISPNLHSTSLYYNVCVAKSLVQMGHTAVGADDSQRRQSTVSLTP